MYNNKVYCMVYITKTYILPINLLVAQNRQRHISNGIFDGIIYCKYLYIDMLGYCNPNS